MPKRADWDQSWGQLLLDSCCCAWLVEKALAPTLSRRLASILSSRLSMSAAEADAKEVRCMLDAAASDARRDGLAAIACVDLLTGTGYVRAVSCRLG